MKIKKIHIIGGVVLAAGIAFIAAKLGTNKKKFEADVEYSQRKIDKIPVTAENVVKGTISENVVATGTLEAAEVLTVVSETQGRIITIFKKKGDMVRAGEVILKVDDEVIAANVLTAEANYEQFGKDIERYKRLAGENAITKRDLEQATIGLKKAKADLTNARKALSNTSLKAPISGNINNDFITVGQLLGGGSPVCEIVNNSSLKLNIKITEREVYKIKTGQIVKVHIAVFPDKTFTGKISSIAQKADAAMKFNVEITLNNNADVKLRSGLYAEAELPVKNEQKIIISKKSIVGSMERPVVYVVENGRAIRRELIIGQSNEKQVEVLKGLSENESVIISGQLNIKDGDEVAVVKQ